MTVLTGLWIAFFACFAVTHLRVRRQRGGGPATENRIHRDRSSDLGMALQFCGMLVSWFFRGPLRSSLLPFALAGAAASVGLVWMALSHLGRQWRVTAVVTDDHELITTGPYSWVRHPVYTAFLGMVASTALVVCPWPLAATACILFIVGTEIRVAAEDRLLGQTFPRDFPAYRARVAAYLPWVR